ncbi:hypothetical protein PN466_02865 [Roseofilum reptotaenium CS-1145]|uniref:Uncharacterized protein n=1 Tax=Roseofilum reptotaenium AO1-A TaxID=1925591 RepID=A0A1L9QRU0_9CYAN|nr:hypothetical protein [Roseofilum reptotaenium]MDB9515901.1 hypothetical protein [Roseofilum reptotaenium CS-1145]OJJ25398.1 hypothetical protein BI308_11415 [Roseofilum reptotaenium AO1-A]
MSDRYLAIGDPGANRVVVYRLNTNKQWSRIQEIHPPQDSIIAQAGVSFGYDLDFDDGVLVIGAYSQVALETDGTNQDFGAIYSIAFLSSMRYSLKP